MNTHDFKFYEERLTSLLTKLRKKYFVDQSIGLDRYTEIRTMLFQRMFAQLGKKETIVN